MAVYPSVDIFHCSSIFDISDDHIILTFDISKYDDISWVVTFAILVNMNNIKQVLSYYHKQSNLFPTKACKIDGAGIV